MRKTSNEIMEREISEAIIGLGKLEKLIKAKTKRLAVILADVKKRHAEMPISMEAKAERRKAKQAEAAKRWREKNREKVLAYQRSYYEKNREKVRARQMARYREIHRLASIAARSKKTSSAMSKSFKTMA